MRARIYDAAILPLTIKWYRAVLERLQPGSKLLDVGVGTAGALCSNAELVKQLELQVLGVDIDAHYIERANQRIVDAGLQEHVQVRLQSIYDCDDKPFDAVYFSASFMLLPDPVAALEQVMGQLAPGGRVFFTQTFQDRRSRLMEKAKPLLKKITTIDFGTVTYEQDFRATVEKANLEILDMVTLGGHGNRSYRLIEGRPRA